jgi:hypothetical protein
VNSIELPLGYPRKPTLDEMGPAIESIPFGRDKPEDEKPSSAAPACAAGQREQKEKTLKVFLDRLNRRRR